MPQCMSIAYLVCYEAASVNFLCASFFTFYSLARRSGICVLVVFSWPFWSFRGAGGDEVDRFYETSKGDTACFLFNLDRCAFYAK